MLARRLGLGDGEEGAWVDVDWIVGWVALTAFMVRVLARRTEARWLSSVAGLVCEPFSYIHMCEILRNVTFPPPSIPTYQPVPMLTNTVSYCILLHFAGAVYKSKDSVPFE